MSNVNVTNLVSSSEEESSDAESEYYYFHVIISNKPSRKFIRVRRRARITFHCLRKSMGGVTLPNPSFGFTLKVGDDAMVDIEKENDEHFDLTSAGDGTVDNMFRVSIQGRS